MSELVNMQRTELSAKLPTIAQQEIPVVSTNSAYMLFYKEK